MHSTNQRDPPDASTIVSRSPGKAYERMRQARPSHFGQPLSRKLLAAGALLALLAGTFAPALLDGQAPVASGSGASAAVALGSAAFVLVALGTLGFAAVGWYRISTEPMTERQALRVLAVEDAAAYLGLATGGLLVVATAAMVAFGVESSVTVSVPAVDPGPGALALVAGVAGVAAVATGRALRGRVPGGP